MKLKLRKVLALLSVTLVMAGCQHEAEDAPLFIDPEEVRFREEAKNVFPREGQKSQNSKKVLGVVNDHNMVHLAEAMVIFREVKFDKLINGNSVIFFSESEITNAMYATYLNDTQQQRDDSELGTASKERRTFSTSSRVITIKDNSSLWRDGIYPSMRENHPVSLLTTGQATQYCIWLERTGGLPGSFRLPTENEWLFAAYGSDRNYPWGDEKKEWAGQSTEPVKSRPKLRTPDGLYGMWGNVSELVLSRSNGYGGTIPDIYSPMITKWLGPSYQDETIAGKLSQPRQDYWGYTHSPTTVSDEMGFRVVYIPKKLDHNQSEVPSEE